MNFTFLTATGKVAFFRLDAEQAEWTQEELSLICTFPVDRKKMIERGMVVLFQDPATEDWHAYEIRNCTIFPGEYYQQFTAESIAISELMDCHIQKDVELSNVTAAVALQMVIAGTGWNIGINQSSGTSLGDIGRGSVWEAVGTIKANWNVYIIPRVTVDSSGITGRYLDILSPDGVWRGFRIAIDKNCSDPCVTYDDSELYTALYGYGATYSTGNVETGQETLETTFKDVVWNKSGEHPGKPAGQLYLEWPEKTALYGRNGKPRYGYYQNTGIEDPNILLEKTWETLKNCSDPKVSITGTVTDLRRLGYKDVPLRLHDMAIIDLNPVGIQLYKQIIKLTVDLLDASKNRPTVGDYIPNIIYINRETEEFATGGGKGAGGGSGRTRSEKKKGEFETSINQNERNIILEARQVDQNRKVIRAAGMSIDPITGVIIYAEDVENGIGANFKVQSNRITAEVTERQAQGAELSSRITQTSNAISLEVTNRQSADNILSSRITMTATEIRSEVRNTAAGLSSRITQNADKVSIVVDDNNNIKTASIVAGINGQDGSYVKIEADKINLSGYVTASELAATNATIDNLTSGRTTASSIAATTMHATNFYLNNNKVTLKRVKDGDGNYISLWGIP